MSADHGTDRTETRIYSGVLYALADEIDSEKGCVTVSAETVREAAERLDVQTITINCLKDHRAELMAALEQFLDQEGNPPADTGEWREVIRAIASVKGSAE